MDADPQLPSGAAFFQLTRSWKFVIFFLVKSAIDIEQRFLQVLELHFAGVLRFFLHFLEGWSKMRTMRTILIPVFLCLLIMLFAGSAIVAADIQISAGLQSQGNPQHVLTIAGSQPYPCEEDLIEVMFAPDSRVRMRNGSLIDFSGNALAGLDQLSQKLSKFEWSRLCDLPEEQLDEIQARGEDNTGNPIYNLNNIYRLRIPAGSDIWTISGELEALPGIIYARPVPKPMATPFPPDYTIQQGYLRPATSVPKGIDADYAWTQTGGGGTGVTVCDLEYSWNFEHMDISKAVGTQVNPNPIVDPFSDNNHGTAVIGEMVSDNNGWGTKGVSFGAALKTCGTYYPYPSPTWNVAGAIAYAIPSLASGDVILLEQQWDYGNPANSFVPIEWWGNAYPNAQTLNPVYAAIQNAVSSGISVVEAGGNGNVNTDLLSWYGNSGAVIVGAGGIVGGAYPEGDLERLSFSSYGSRFDLQGWGEGVTTTGYGDLDSTEGVNFFYTSQFAGTSSASPIVASAIACCTGYGRAHSVSTLNLKPAKLLEILSYTGTPQALTPPGNIGPRPDLRAAFTQMIDFLPFAAAMNYNVIGNPASVSCADLNRDGDLDLVVANQVNQGVSTMENNGNGTFQSPINYSTGAGPASVFCADFDRDGYSDVAVVNGVIETVSILMNKGDGAFKPRVNYAAGSRPNSIFCADLDGDMDIDLVVTNEGTDNVSVFMNNGDGIFQTRVDYNAGDRPYSISGGDLDGDGDVDLVTANWGSSDVSVLMNNGSGAFASPVSLAAGSGTVSVFCADIDKDADLDVVAANHNLNDVSIFKNNGNGTFQTKVDHNIGNAPWSVFCADLDGDLDLDVVVANSNGTVSVLKNKGNGTFPPAADYAAGSSPSSVYCADVDKDLDLDIAVANSGSNNISILKNLGNVVALGGVSGGVRSASTQHLSGVLVEALQKGIVKGSGVSNSGGIYNVINLPPGTYEVRASKLYYDPQSEPGVVVTAGQTTLVDFQMNMAVLIGDVNHDAIVNVSDVVYLISYIFSAGPEPNPVFAGDADCNRVVNISDVVFLVGYIFAGGPAPCSKF